MKICYLSNSALPSNYASSIQIVKMCEAFSEIGNDVVLISRGINNKKKIFDFYNVKFKYLIEILDNFKKFPLGIKYYLFSIVSIFKSFEYKPEIYITRNLFTCFLLVLLRKKIILELHHDLEIESRIVKFLIKRFKYLNSSYIKKIIAITEGVQDIFVKKYFVNKKKILVSPSGSSLKNKIFYTNKKPFLNIGYFGSVYESRGFDILCNLAKLDKINNYYVYGNLNIKKNLIKLRSIKNLYLNSYIPYKYISKEISKMDVLLMPYASSITVAGNIGDITKYTSPLKLFDYLTAGKVIMCSDFKVLREVIREKRNAIFVKNYKNIYSWRNEIYKLKNQYSKRLIISKNNLILSKKFSLKNRAKKIIKNI